MRRLAGLSIVVVSALAMGVTIAKAGGWANFKLKNFSRVSSFHNQSQALGDIRLKQLTLPERLGLI